MRWGYRPSSIRMREVNQRIAERIRNSGIVDRTPRATSLPADRKSSARSPSHVPAGLPRNSGLSAGRNQGGAN
jgi:hypothetical protein